MRTRLGYYFFLTVLILGLARCAVEDCATPYSKDVVVAFVSINNRGLETEVTTTAWDTVYGLGADTGLYASTSQARYNLTLNPARDSATFLFRKFSATDTTNDTLSIRYATRQRILGLECGVEIYYANPEIYYHTFDSVYILDSTLELGDNPLHAYIYNL